MPSQPLFCLHPLVVAAFHPTKTKISAKFSACTSPRALLPAQPSSNHQHAPYRHNHVHSSEQHKCESPARRQQQETKNSKMSPQPQKCCCPVLDFPCSLPHNFRAPGRAKDGTDAVAATAKNPFTLLLLRQHQTRPEQRQDAEHAEVFASGLQCV